VSGTTVSRFTASFGDRVVAMILDGVLKERRSAAPVRNVAAANTESIRFTVLKGYQQLVDGGLVETSEPGHCFINTGARKLLLARRTAEVPCRRMAPGPRDHSAAGPDTRRTRGGRKTRVEARKSKEGALKPWHARSTRSARHSNNGG